MSIKRVLVLAALVSAGMSQVAFADEDQEDSSDTPMDMMSETDDTGSMSMGSAASQMGMMTGDMMPMMRMMMQMHENMMGGNGQMGMMDAGNRMAMMDRDMMGMMMPDGNPENMAPHMAVKMQEFDGDSDGALTLEEFEALHTNAVRDRMVDRFQHLDADADGAVTQEEMQAAGTRIGAMGNIFNDGAANHHGDDN